MKLGIFITHPVQYQVPLWVALSQRPGWQVKVFYFSEQGVGGATDPGFGQVVTWDLPLLEGYAYQFLAKLPIQEESNFRIPDASSLFESEAFDVILIHGYTHAFARQILRKKRRFKYKIILHGEFTDMHRRPAGWKDYVRNIYLRWFYGHVDHFCPIGMDAIDHLKKRDIPDSQMTVTPYSVDDQLFEEQRKKLNRVSCREELGIMPEQVVFLFSGKLIPRKQPLLLAEAVERLAKDYPQIVLVFLGDGEQFDQLYSTLSPLLGRNLIAPGFVNQSELGRYFRAADVFVLPSKYDTWGLVVNEAMHFGLPCIVSDRVGSRRDLVIPGKTGRIFHYDDVKELADSMRYFLDKPDEAKRMGISSHEHIKGFTIEKTVTGLITAMSSVTG